jgi:hypothetical protein
MKILPGMIFLEISIKLFGIEMLSKNSKEDT